MKPSPRPTITLYVAPDGDDTWNGLRPAPRAARPEEGPFATPKRAREAVREARRNGHLGPVRVRLRGGIYRLDEALVLGAEDGAGGASRKDDADAANSPGIGVTRDRKEPDTVVWEAYGNEEPIFDGGRVLSGWKLATKLPRGCPKEARGKLFVAKVPKGHRFSRLYFDGEALPRATSVTSDDWRSWPICELGEASESEIRVPPGLIPPGDSAACAILNYMPTPYTRWSNAFSPVVAYDRRRRVITHGEFVLPRPERTKEIPFRLENIASGLTAPGRWFLDDLAGLLYLLPPGEQNPEEQNPGEQNPEEHEVVAPFLTELLRIEGSGQPGLVDKSVRRLVVRGITFRHARLPESTSGFDGPGAALLLDGLSDCRIEQCRFYRLGSNAIKGGPEIERTTIRRCEISDLGAGGIILVGKHGLPPFGCVGNRITDCTITRCGRLYWHSSGISVNSTERTVIAHNLLHNLPYAGIFVGGGPRHTYFRGWPRSFPELEALWKQHGSGEPTIDGVKRFIPGHNRIEANVVHHVMQILDDGAAIYCHAAHHDLVRGNVVYAIESPMGMGLYFDDEEMDSIMKENLVYRCPDNESLEARSAVIHLHHNGRHRVVNNLLVGGKQVLSIPNGYAGHRIERNAFIFAGEPNWDRADPAAAKGAGDGRRQVGWDAGRSVVRKNLWWSPQGSRFAASLLEIWRRRGYGEGSIVGNPLFRNPEQGDYRLMENSPLFSIGFKAFDLSGAGPRQGIA